MVPPFVYPYKYTEPIPSEGRPEEGRSCGTAVAVARLKMPIQSCTQASKQQIVELDGAH